MRFIRIFWGDLAHHEGIHEREIIEAKEDNLDEVVYVWGTENEEFIKNCGYETRLMHKDNFEFATDFVDDGAMFFKHKYAGMKAGIEEFGSVCFLDWDCRKVKSINPYFYEQLTSGIMVPLYTYPVDYLDQVLGMYDFPDKDVQFLHKYEEGMKKYSWKVGNDYYLPCSCFMYCNNVKIIDDFVDLLHKHEGIFSDEFVWYLYAQEKGLGKLEDYIEVMEPTVVSSKLNNHFNQTKLEADITKIKEKEIFFQHY